MATSTPAARPSRTARARPRSRSWERFRQSLEAVLASLSEGQFLVVSTKQGNRYVQFARNGAGVRAETVSNSYLPPGEQLTKTQVSALGRLGWTAPTHAKGEAKVPNGSPNFHRLYEKPLPCGEIALLAARTLSEVMRVRSPAHLQYKAFEEPGARDVELPHLGIDKEHPTPSSASTQGFTEVKSAVLAAIHKASQQDVAWDEDNDLRVNYGDAILFVRISDEPRFVRVASVVATKLKPSTTLLERINDFNRKATFLRFLVTKDAVITSTDVFGHPLVPAHVVHACHAVGEASNDLRQMLELEFRDRAVLRALPRGALKN